MRRATNSTEWFVHENGQLLGLALGFDFCAEHEMGVSCLKRYFGIIHDRPEGLEQRRIQSVPGSLIYETYERSTKGEQPTQSCALLALDGYDTLANLKSDSELRFWSEPGDQWHEPQHDSGGDRH